MLDETEFLSDYGVRALSKVHETRAVRVPRERRGPQRALPAGGVRLRPVRRQLELARADLVPGELPDHRVAAEVPSLLRRRLQASNVPPAPGSCCTIDQVADEIASRLERLFLKDEHGVRPVLGQYPQLQSDPHFRDYVLFHEYFHGDTGRGVGAAHQTGWTGLVAKLLKPRKRGARRPPRLAARRLNPSLIHTSNCHEHRHELPRHALADHALVPAAETVARSEGARHRRKLRHRPRHRAGARRSRRRRRRELFLRRGQGPRGRATKPRSSGVRAIAVGADVSDEAQVQRDVRADARRVRHDRHPREQRRPAAGRAVRGADAEAVEQGDRREPHGPVPLLARSGARVQAPRRAQGRFVRGRQDPLHQLGPRSHSLGRSRQLRRVEGRRDADDEEHRAGSRAVPHPRQQHLPGRDPHADQHGSVGHAGGLQRAAEADSVQAHRRARRDRPRRRVARIRLRRLHPRREPVRRRRHDAVSGLRDRAADP